MKRFFIINGEAQAGKDTFVSLCQDVVKTAINESDVIWNYSMVDKIKQIAKECGWDGEKTPEARKFLSDLKGLIYKANRETRLDEMCSGKKYRDIILVSEPGMWQLVIGSKLDSVQNGLIKIRSTTNH